MNEQLVVFPEGSVAVAFTVVVPTGNAEPEGDEVETVAEQLSLAVTVKFTIAVH